MSGLTDKDVKILSFYAEKGNRELYWNYLAQTPGNDGYGLLALGVVRNDNVPGQVANSYAQSAAHASKPGMTERQWEAFGVDLMKRDLIARQEALADNKPERALNLSAADVRRVHDRAFVHAGIEKEAWTPRKLMDMAERKGGPAAMEEIWAGMLDNQKLGLYRGVSTLSEVRAHTDLSSLTSIRNSAEYVVDMTAARVAAHSSLPNTNPNLIGSLNHSYIYSTGDNSWTEVRQLPGASVPLPPSFTEVRDRRLIEQLNDTRELRLEKLALREQRHPDDPYRTIAKSPFTLAEVSPDNSDAPGESTRLAQTETDSQWTTHSQSVLRALEERLPPGSSLSEDRLAQLTAATKVARISESERLDVQVADDYITIRGEHPARIAQVDLRQPVPTAAESHEIFISAEQAQVSSAYRQAEQSQQAQQAQRGLERA